MYLEFDIFQPLWVKFKGESCDDKSRSVHFFWHNAHEKKNNQNSTASIPFIIRI